MPVATPVLTPAQRRAARASLVAQLDAIDAAAGEDVAAIATPLVAHALVVSPCKDSANGKTWNGSNLRGELTIDGRAYAFSLLVTDVEATNANKAAAKAATV